MSFNSIEKKKLQSQGKLKGAFERGPGIPKKKAGDGAFGGPSQGGGRLLLGMKDRSGWTPWQFALFACEIHVLNRG